MEIKKDIDENGHYFDVKFSKDETRTISAIYSEAINRRIKAGNEESISDHDKRMMRLYKRRSGFTSRYRDLGSLEGVLRTFGEDTESQARELVDVCALHENHAPLERLELGEAAIVMLGEVEEFRESQQLTQEQEQEHQKIIESFDVPNYPPSID